MKHLHISPDLSLPLDAVTQTFAILAKRRVGKTYTASVMAEEMCKAGLPFVALDPTGAWWGLRAAADGKREGFPVTIIGGAHGDIPLEPTAGKVIAELVVDHPGFYVLDLSQTASNAEQDRFAADFAERLYRYKDAHRDPLHLFIDEADSFAPQRPLDGQQRMLGAFEALVRRGGIRGIGMTMITQRPAVLNKNVLTQAEVLIVLQMNAPQDQKAIDDWVQKNGTLEERNTMMASLASLKRGQAWVWSPAWLEMFKLIQIRERETFNSSATPKAGEKTITPKQLAPVDIEQLRSKIAGTLERAKENDPALLKRQVADLQRQLAIRPVVAPMAPKLERIEVTVFRDGEVARLEAAISALASAGAQISAAGQHVITAAQEVTQGLRAAATRLSVQPKSIVSQPMPPARLPVTRPTPAPQVTDDKLGKGERALLVAIAQHSDGVVRDQLSVLTGYKRSSRDTYLQRLRARNLIVDGQTITATPEGIAELGDGHEPLPTGYALQQHWMGRLPEGEKRVLAAALEAYPATVDRETLVEQTGYKRSSRDTYIQRLQARRLLAPKPGAIRASDTLFD